MNTELGSARHTLTALVAVAGVAVLGLAACNRTEPADAPAPAPAAGQPVADAGHAPRDMGSDAADEYDAMTRAAQTPRPAAPGVQATIPAGDATVTVNAPAH